MTILTRAPILPTHTTLTAGPYGPRGESMEKALDLHLEKNIVRSLHKFAGISVFFVKVCIFHNQKMHVYLIFYFYLFHTLTLP